MPNQLIVRPATPPSGGVAPWAFTPEWPRLPWTGADARRRHDRPTWQRGDGHEHAGCGTAACARPAPRGVDAPDLRVRRPGLSALQRSPSPDRRDRPHLSHPENPASSRVPSEILAPTRARAPAHRQGLSAASRGDNLRCDRYPSCIMGSS